ncbi:alpha/beta fold hydrolase [Nocardiopsis coralliicola]
MPPNRDQLIERLLRLPSVHTVRRPLHEDTDEEFDLRWVREGPDGGTPLLIIPGGPGLASVAPYHRVRKQAGARGFDTVMAEHRGVGLSRLRDGGAGLPPEAVTSTAAADDLAAVLDAAGIDRAVVWGSSYGGYLGQLFAHRHPDRVAGLVLDSAITSSDSFELARAHVRRLLWDGGDPATEQCAALLRELTADGAVDRAEAATVLPVVYEFTGARGVERLLAAAARGRWNAWQRVQRLAGKETTETVPCVMEFDLVADIWFRDLHGIEPDGRPLDTARTFDALAEGRPSYAGPAFDIEAAQKSFAWPTAVLSGARDLRAVRPAGAAAAERIPGAALVPFDDSGHSFLDRFPFAGLLAAGAVAAGRHTGLPGYAARAEHLRGITTAHAVAAYISAALAIDAVPRPR